MMYSSDVFVEAHIADIHFGSIDPKVTYDILNEQFINYLEDMNVLDIICIEGDLFDHKFMANSDAVVYAAYLVQRLVKICKDKNSTLILISGTSSHDADQLKLFYPYMSDNTVDVRVITTTQFIFVKGKKILCIPELYGKGEEYYDYFLNQSGWYDACYMHGTFKGSIIGKNESDLNSNREPVFDIMDFGGCLGPIISGHVHVQNVYKQDFYYCGSPIRYRYGEEKEKGFYILLHNIKTREYLMHFEPIYSFRYDTVRLDKMLELEPDVIISYINNLSCQGIDHLRVIFTKECPEKIPIIKASFKSNQGVDIETNYEQFVVKQKLEEINKENSQFDYLFDDNLSCNLKMVNYMNQVEGSQIWTLESFENFLHQIEKI